MLEDKDYLEIVKDIIESDEFKELKKYKHHGINRYDHSVRVSYWAYKRAKKRGLDYKACARAGLLHDFYLVNNQEVTLKERIKVLRSHNNIAADVSKVLFEINDKEAEIIRTHMFPVNSSVPMSKEAWIVNTADKLASSYERLFLAFTKNHRFKSE